MLPKKPFFVMALPRSRTAWLSSFLSYQSSQGLRKVGHDLVVRCNSIEDFKVKMLSFDGTVETALVTGWKVVKDLWPESKIIVIHRDLADIVNSCRRLGLEPDIGQLVERKEMLDMVSNCPGVRSYWFEQLESPDCCREIFEHLLGLPFDVNWWSELARRNIQINMEMRIQELMQRHDALRSLHLEVLAEAQKLGGSSCLGLQ